MRFVPFVTESPPCFDIFMLLFSFVCSLVGRHRHRENVQIHAKEIKSPGWCVDGNLLSAWMAFYRKCESYLQNAVNFWFFWSDFVVEYDTREPYDLKRKMSNRPNLILIHKFCIFLLWFRFIAEWFCWMWTRELPSRWWLLYAWEEKRLLWEMQR